MLYAGASRFCLSSVFTTLITISCSMWICSLNIPNDSYTHVLFSNSFLYSSFSILWCIVFCIFSLICFGINPSILFVMYDSFIWFKICCICTYVFWCFLYFLLLCLIFLVVYIVGLLGFVWRLFLRSVLYHNQPKIVCYMKTKKFPFFIIRASISFIAILSCPVSVNLYLYHLIVLIFHNTSSEMRIQMNDMINYRICIYIFE